VKSVENILNTKLRIPTLAGAVLSLACACAAGPKTPASWRSPLDRDHPMVGRIEAVAAQRTLERGALFDALAEARVVVLGEKHDNPDHHALQAQAIDALVARGRKPAVVFEMIARSQQAALDEARARAPRDVDAIAAALDWQRSGWPEWSLYRPVFESAVRHGLPIVAGSLDRAQVMEVARRGTAALEPAFVAEHRLGEPSTDASADALREEMRQAHCSMLPESMLDTMVLVQRARDAMLASQAHAALARAGSVVLIAGNGHARRDRGVPRHLERAYGVTARVLALLEVQRDTDDVRGLAPDDAGGALPYDYVWLTPRASDEDPCASLREQHSHEAGR
jgi:uncharacterized iron-regulated protein